MLHEIINYTKDLKNDNPDIMKRNLKPSDGLHIFVRLDEETGKWNGNMQKDIDYFIVNNSNKEDKSCICNYEIYGKRMTMNKTLDIKKKILSCSPYIINFNKKAITEVNGSNKDTEINFDKVKKSIPGYFNNAIKLVDPADEKSISIIKQFQNVLPEIFESINQLTKVDGNSEKNILKSMKSNNMIFIYLLNADLEEYKKAYNNYLTENLFSTNNFNSDDELTEETFGLSAFLNGFNRKKPFLYHKTAMDDSGLSGRIQLKDARLLYDFETLLNNHTLPNPLPIVIDKRELNNDCITIFNDSKDKLNYHQLIKQLMENANIDEIHDYYLMYWNKRMHINIYDFDFISDFKYKLKTPIRILNETGAGEIKNIKEKDPDILLKCIFDFETIVFSTIFNNQLNFHYFDDDIKTSNNMDGMLRTMILQYRKSIYDFIYKSKFNAITENMFNDMMYNSILINIHTSKEKVNFYFSKNNSIKRKINIWFSLENVFNNNKNIKNKKMKHSITELLLKTKNICQNDNENIETNEEFAFAAGQLVSFLIDRSVSGNKTYRMLEPYLQKINSGSLQNKITETFIKYKYAISIYDMTFKSLASQVLTYDTEVVMKPVLKYFLAGCFSPCQIYNATQNK